MLRRSFALGLLLPLLLPSVACESFRQASRNSTAEAELEAIARRVQTEPPAAVLPALEAYTTEYPEQVLGWVIRGNVQLEADLPDDALKSFDQALKHDARSVEAHTGKGIAFRQKQQYEPAMEAYEAALAIDPDYAQALSSVGVLYMKRGDHVLALRRLERAWKLDSTDGVVAANLAVCYHMVGKPARRDELVEKARELGYDKLDVLQKLFDGELTIED